MTSSRRSSTPWPTTSTPRRRAPSCSTGWRRPTAGWTRGSAVGPGRLGEMLYALGLETLLEAEDEAPEELQRLAAERDEARAARDFERADQIRDQLAGGRLGDPRHPRGRPARAAVVIVYGRNPVREALRGRRRVQRVFATERAAQEVWLGGVETVHRGAVGARGALRLARPSGDLRGGRARIRTWTRTRSSTPRTLSCSRSTRCRTRTTSARSSAWPRRPAARAWSCPSAARPRSRRRCAARRRARWSTCPWRGCGNLADWLEIREGAARTLWVYGAAAEASVPYDRPDYSGRVVLVLGSEGRGLRPRVAETCDELVASAEPRARSDRSTCPPPRRPWCTESCTFADRNP